MEDNRKKCMEEGKRKSAKNWGVMMRKKQINKKKKTKDKARKDKD